MDAYTLEQLTAEDGRVWTQEEVELMAQWWEAHGEKFDELNDKLLQLWGVESEWLDWVDPEAVDLEREKLYRQDFDSLHNT